MKPAQRLTLAIVLADLGLVALFFGLALFNHSASTIIPRLALRWEIARAGLDFLAWFAPLQFFVALLVVATLRGETEGIVVNVAIPSILLAAIVAALALVFGPSFERQLSSSLSTSARFMETLDDLKTALIEGEAERGRLDLDILRAIDYRDVRLVELEKRLGSLEVKDSRERAESKAATASASTGTGDLAAIKTAWTKARAFFDRGDWYNAHWQASLAYKLDPGLLEAKRLAGLAWEEIMKAAGTTSLDERGASFYARKLEGYGLLRSEDYIGALRIFDALAKEDARDPEVRRYLKEGLAGVERTAFWLDEAEKAAENLSIPRLFLRYKTGVNEAILVARECAFEKEAAYLFAFHYLELHPDGSARLLRAPWAKIAAGRLYLIAAERARPGEAWRPEAFDIPAGTAILAGERGTKIPGARVAKAPASLDLALRNDELYNLAASRRRPETLSLFDAWKTLFIAPAWGIDPENLLLDILRRLGIPFMAFGSAVIGVLVGLRFRLPQDREGRPSILALPLIAAAVALGAVGIGRLDDLASLWCARFLPDTRALWLSAGLRFAFILSVALLAVGAAREEQHAHINQGSED